MYSIWKVLRIFLFSVPIGQIGPRPPHCWGYQVTHN